MKTTILTICTLLCLNLTVLAKPQAAQKPDAAARKAAKAKNTKADWEADLQEARAPLGKVQSRKFKNGTYAKDPPGAPPGEYEILHYITDFAELKPMAETVYLMRRKDGKWHVSGYFFKLVG